jgi:hypothetical protein
MVFNIAGSSPYGIQQCWSWRGNEALLRFGRSDGEAPDIDSVLGEALGVLGHAELFEPISDLLHRGSAPD